MQPTTFPPYEDFTPLALHIGSWQDWFDTGIVASSIVWSEETDRVAWTAGDQLIVRMTDTTQVAEPGAPAVVATPGDGHATLVWTPTTDEGGSPITGYEYRYRKRTDAEYPDSWTEVAGGGGARRVTVPGLYNGVPHGLRGSGAQLAEGGRFSRGVRDAHRAGACRLHHPRLQSVAEDAGTATLTVSLHRPAESALSVSWHTQDERADAPDDYTARQEAVTFAAGEDRKTISVPIVDDAVREDPVNGFHENFWVIVGSGEGYTRGGYAIVEIVDNDGDAAPDVTPPRLLQRTVNGTTLVLTYDETLDDASVPAVGDFVVQSGGNTISVSQVSVDGSKVTLTLAAPCSPTRRCRSTTRRGRPRSRTLRETTRVRSRAWTYGRRGSPGRR